MSRSVQVSGRMLCSGQAGGPVVTAPVGLSFWGGVDPLNGIVLDRHHPLAGECLTGKVLAVPGGRGSCTGSCVMLELILNGVAPAAIIVCEHEEIYTLGALIAQVFFDRTMPVLQISREAFVLLGQYRFARIEGQTLILSDEPTTAMPAPSAPIAQEPGGHDIALAPIDRALLAGEHGKAAQVAMRLVLKMAELQGATRFMDVTQAHIDGCIYIGPASLRFAQMLRDLGAKVRVPTTLNAISVDRRRWRELGVDATLGEPASALADTYTDMGARPTFTCAPYLLDSAPAFGAQIGWAESNAVVYANSVLGARTMKYPDFMDICIAITGRAPYAGCHRDEGRRATCAIDVQMPEGADDSFWPLVGYCCGAIARHEIPLVRGLENTCPTLDDLKAFGAAFATSAGAPMFHIAGVTPEADRQPDLPRTILSVADLLEGWKELNTGDAGCIGLVSLGNPHFSASEMHRLADLLEGRMCSEQVKIVVTCGRAVFEQATQAGDIARLDAFGVQVIQDTCWCMLGEPIVPPDTHTIMTNSGKYAHYAPGLVGCRVRFGSLADCVEAARTGAVSDNPPAWLQPATTLHPNALPA
ncbi:cis-3-hydroxy-L-proline dehydratase [Acetobacter garciniae]|uniref:cis-3-hydroxy-L-proline dehydratase n=1 Tax=Acetobacter garciniae TaxID=2817435 RepID=UPI001E36DD55|nr:aconitase family protein [Acetobacter garciniae]